MDYQINSVLSEKVIELHERGYEFDFRLIGTRNILCLQNNLSYSFTDALVTKSEENFDELTGTYKQIYTVDTCCGIRGLLVVETSCPLNIRVRVMRVLRMMQRFLSA
ncbi:MAG: hypothetical protein V4560_00095 [Bacteroidota bacterium]